MPLKLVTGPANSAKAGHVLGALRRRVHEEPILVVPVFGDVEHAQREMAGAGAVFGVRVVRFAWLFEEIARRQGVAARIASDLQRQLVVEEAIQAARLTELRHSAERPGFARAAAHFVSELGRSMVDPPRLTQALRVWAGEGPRRRYADEVAAIYGRYRAGLEAAQLVDPELFARRALDAFRRDPRRFGDNPVYVYGFDDFTELELDAIESLARQVAVTVSVPYERGRAAFRAIAPVFERLAALASEHVELEASDEHYAGESREALHHLERGLFTDDPQPRTPGRAVRRFSAGGERAEVELAGAEVLDLLRSGTPPGEVAVVFRDPDRYASIVEQVFDAYGIPFSIDRSVPLAHTGLGRGLLALIRCAVMSGSADDLLAYLRTPGKLEEPALADRLEARVRQEGADDGRAARSIWGSRQWPLDELDRLAGAPSPLAFLAEVARELERLFAAPYRRRAPQLDAQEIGDARVFAAAHAAISELQAVLTADPGVRVDHRRVHDMLAALPVRVGENPQPDRVQVADPQAVRARRFAAVIVCGLQEREFPRGASPEPFLPDEDRRAIAAASGLRLPLREEQVDRERYLFYVCASRAEHTLVLSSRYCDEEGNAEAGSFFVEDVADLFDGLSEPSTRRSLSDVTWNPEKAPTQAEWERAVARLGPRRPGREVSPLSASEVLAHLAAREAYSAGALERFADCPVKWLVEDLLDPQALEPDAEALVRGQYAHAVLEATYRRLRERTGSRRVNPDNLADAERILLAVLEKRRAEYRLSSKQARVRAALRRLEFDLLRYLRHEAHRDGLFEPEHLELSFGLDGGEPVELGEELRLRGKIDRVDTWDGYALVRDYKSGSSVNDYRVARWKDGHRFQAALYMLVVERLLGLKPAGGVYVPLGGKERRPRGLVAEELAGELGSDFFDGDREPEGQFQSHLATARAAIAEAAAQMRSGQLAACPESCAWRGGCSYPSICRTEH